MDAAQYGLSQSRSWQTVTVAWEKEQKTRIYQRTVTEEDREHRLAAWKDDPKENT
jgi:hypothetical protein